MNEIITYGQNYTLNKGIKAFIKSAVKTGNKTTVIGYNLQNDTIKFFKENNVNYVDALPIAAKYNVDLNLSPYTLKVIFFYLYCNKISTASSVFLCDFTDVYFQDDVFKFLPKTQGKPTVFIEPEQIANCKTNTTWMNLCYNNDIYNLTRGYEIINGGAILGHRERCAELLKEMCSDISIIIGRVGNYPNIDQAVLNKAVRFDYLRYNIFSWDVVANMAYANVKLPVVIRNSKIVVGDVIPAVVHQYDVNKDIEKFINEQS
jgi:hypothetical protein